MLARCRPRGFPPRNIQPGILGPPPALPPQHALRLMRMRLLRPVVFPVSDLHQRLPAPVDFASMMHLPPAESTEASNGKILLCCIQLAAVMSSSLLNRSNDDDDDDEGRINFSMALSPKTTRTRNNKLKQ